MKVCSSCSRVVSMDFVEFKCPSCGKKTIRRCVACRAASKQYTCPGCGFVGP